MHSLTKDNLIIRLSYSFTLFVFLWSVYTWSVSWLPWVVLFEEWEISCGIFHIGICWIKFFIWVFQNPLWTKLIQIFIFRTCSVYYQTLEHPNFWGGWRLGGRGSLAVYQIPILFLGTDILLICQSNKLTFILLLLVKIILWMIKGLSYSWINEL